MFILITVVVASIALLTWNITWNIISNKKQSKIAEIRLKNDLPDDLPIAVDYENINKKSTHVGVILTIFIWIIIVFWSLLSVVDNINTRAKLINFYHNNQSLYQSTVDNTASYFSSDDFKNQIFSGSVEKQQLANAVSQRSAEMRDAMIDYNNSLTIYQTWSNNPFTNIFWPSLPDDIKPIVMNNGE